ncbi:hypothetical protein MtrunA17_Chr7g0268921 [Medicago truncatula]|uniref:Uncharacterized protein n=1 Tax=Medicago truncatula TaxID=3880 RepID=A0A396H6Q2_MEDTR|nr:hypothetical protein MtrunA17_Chr7g0268921 [Medicago truncatula]
MGSSRAKSLIVKSKPLVQESCLKCCTYIIHTFRPTYTLDIDILFFLWNEVLREEKQCCFVLKPAVQMFSCIDHVVVPNVLSEDIVHQPLLCWPCVL